MKRFNLYLDPPAVVQKVWCSTAESEVMDLVHMDYATFWRRQDAETLVCNKTSVHIKWPHVVSTNLEPSTAVTS